MDFSEKWGRDVAEAVDLALKDLKLDRDQVEVIVLEEPSKGFFGIGSKLAKVRVQKSSKKENRPEAKAENRFAVAQKIESKKESKSEPKKEGRTELKKESRAEPRGEKSKDTRDEKQTQTSLKEYAKYSIKLREKPENLQAVTETPALNFLKEVTARMGLELSIKAMGNEESLYFDISGKDSGTIIGKRGQTLDSIQYLTSLVANKDSEKYTRVIVDAENYREKRERTLEQLANRLADKVYKTGKSVRLEPMNPYERKVIHSTLQKNPEVTTRSEGEEPYRRVIIEQK